MIPPRPGAGRVSELALRTASSVVLIAAALAAAYVGGLFFAAFWILAGVAVGVEWAWLVAGDPPSRRWTARVVAATLGVAGAALSLSIYLYVAPVTAAFVLLAGAVVAAFLARPAYFAAVAIPYGAAVFVGAMLLRRDPHDGLLAILWLFAVVWSTDIAAFFAGRAFGGPKLAPLLSPNKTWSGAIGGATAAVAAGVAVAAGGGAARLWPIVVVALVTSAASQFGDLFESGVKRAYGAKDSSKLIPGHGGLMDRLDGFLFAATVAAAIGVARGGLDAAGEGLLRW
ncbi:phosphatidate cytidylyltransferase [Hansschlegelia zhihuaiae]|uniref:phosphatidate cytidylyltransferase n=1 Tax=Hansschlegelia zhihuaiae TaxID=405005 RepID=UPI001FE1FFF2|nr:phosphatidate cytidylyltransferase [Hansschlegelia zhihuaiae]